MPESKDPTTHAAPFVTREFSQPAPQAGAQRSGTRTIPKSITHNMSNSHFSLHRDYGFFKIIFMRVRIIELAEYEYDVTATGARNAAATAKRTFLSEKHQTRAQRRVGSVERDFIVIDDPDQPSFHEEDFDATRADS